MNHAIQTNQLTRDFGSLRAVDHLTLEVPAGQIFGLLGPNGAGKTTTIRLLLGLLPPTSGQVRVLGMDPLRQGEAVRSRCGALLEHAGLYERLSAEDNLDVYARIWRMDAASRKKRIQELLEGLGLWGTAQRDSCRMEPRHETKTGHRPRSAAPPSTGLSG